MGSLILIFILLISLFIIYEINKFIKIDKKSRLIYTPKPKGKNTFYGNFFLSLSSYLSMRKKKPIKNLSETGKKEMEKSKRLSILGTLILIVLLIIYIKL